MSDWKLTAAKNELNTARKDFIERCKSSLFANAVETTYSKLLKDVADKDREEFLFDVSHTNEHETPSRFALWYYRLHEYVGTQFFYEQVWDRYLESIVAFTALTELQQIDGRSRLGKRVVQRFC
ncbi:hypothetical protein Kim5_CH00810 [Rhizobium sp. Kim5]|uniref:hypothetical protein n=1 Tax=Rhizobium sp. Kim5 TaxID=2020311 RepID=UPI000A29F669|nr:hypothetical protein [Rhizobium sp. Kim5]ARQ56917.1 hypothetical protein Kim5_CH00810 [Rhizobium sp. Kim5]